MEHISTKQAATYIGCSHHTLRKSRYTGILLGRKTPQYFKLGSKVSYRTVDLEQWLSELSPVQNTAMAVGVES